MNQTEQILSQLRDIQTPPPPESVSLWLMAANLMLLLVLLTGLYRRWRRKRQQWRRDALKQVHQARTLEPAAALLVLAKLLRQIMLYRQYNISTDSQAWLVNLDKAFDTNWFTQAEGQAFGSALYQQPTLTVEELQSLCKRLEQLIRKLPSRLSHAAQQPARQPVS